MAISSQIICIGNEIMLGSIPNTNAQFISIQLAEIGIPVSKHISVPDEQPAIISSIKNSLEESPIVILTGGLGPTVDDITLECISKATNRKLISNPQIVKEIKNHFHKRRIKMPKNNLRQALIPKGTIPIPNPIGTAPGLIIPGERVLIALPGVPFEMQPMVENSVIPYLKKSFPSGKIIKSRLIKITGLAESRVNELIYGILNLSGNVQMGIYPYPEEIHVKITVTEKTQALAGASINKIEKKIKARLKDYIFGYDNERLEDIVGKILLQAKKTLSIAESCTGGLLADRITNVPGSSKYFKMGLTAYSNESKINILNIPLEIINKYGAVSKETALLMAKNVRIIADTDIGIGITGIAGPGGAVNNKDIGLVFISVSTKNKTICEECHFIGTRQLIKYKSTQKALDMVRRETSDDG